MKTKCENRLIKEIISYLFILIGSILYALSTVLFIFQNSLLLGGTSGISVILNSFIDFSPGMILTVINTALIVLAFIVLGKEMALKTLVGSVLTTASVAVIEKVIILKSPVIPNPYISAIVGAAIIAVASGIMFYCNSSSGGTDVIALIVRKFSNINIGKALLITDILIVIVGGVLSGLTIAVSSVIGLLIKTLGIDLVIFCIKRMNKNA